MHIPILLPHNHFPLFKKLCHNTIQTIQLHILFQWDQNYFLQSNILFTQYILTPVHPLNTTYIIIYLNTLWVGLCPHTHFTPPWPFPLSKILCHNMIQTIQLHILFQWDQNYFFQSNILFTQYILTPVHPLNTTYIIIYLNTLWVGLCPHTHFTPPWPFLPVQKIMSQHDSNYSTTHIISMGSKLFPSVKYTFHSIYSNTSPSTKHNLWNNLFKHTLGGFMSTYPFYSSMAISPCPKYYVTTQFKLFNYTYYFNGIKIISFSQIYFSLNIF